MNKCLPLFIMLFSFPVFGQGTIQSTSNEVTNILTHENLQTSLEVAKATSPLEDLLHQDVSCSEIEDSQDESCRGFANSLLPQGYVEKGWKTLLEIKYQPGVNRESRTAVNNYVNESWAEAYYDYSGKKENSLSTGEDFNNEFKNILKWYEQNAPGQKIDHQSLKNGLLLRQLRTTENYDQMMGKVKNLSQGMSDQEYMSFISSVAGWVDYNYERAEFVQQEGAGKGVVGTFDQIMKTKAGVCGDIHSMAAKLAEQRGWEAFTIGYAMNDMQHVVTAIVDPKNPNKLTVVNYGHYEESALNDGNSILPVPTTHQQELGIQLRIFKNDGKNGADGAMEQIATVPTALGSFMADLFKHEKQIERAMPSNENFRNEKLTFETENRKVKLKKDDKKVVDKTVGDGVIIYEGETENARIFGVAVSHEVFKDIYRYDPKTKKCVPKKSKYFSLGVAGSLVDLPAQNGQDIFYAYLNMKGGQIFHVYQTDHFQFKGVIGYEFEAFTAPNAIGEFTADANFATLMGVVAEYNKNGTKIETAFTVETNIGMRNQNLMNDFSTIPSNVSPARFNALSLDTKFTKKINDNNTFVTDTSLAMTNVGGRVFLSTGIIHNNTTIMASYQGGMKSIPIGNSLQNINLLQNFNSMDGFRLSASQNFSNKKGNLSGSVSGWGGFSTSTPQMTPMGGASLKINLGGKRKRRPASK